MPTPLDRLLQSPAKAAFLSFAAVITAVSAYAIFSDTPVFPPPTGESDGARAAGGGPLGDPDTWTLPECRGWLEVRGLMPADSATREELAERVKLNMRRDRGYGATE